jgi:mono/diheme cytochrome c family protein
MRQLIIVLSLALMVASELAAELTSRERSIVRSVNTAVAKAGETYKAGDYDAAGSHIQRAIKQIDLAVKAGSPDLFDALQPAIQRIAKAHTMLEFEGVTLPPFRQPKRPQAAEMNDGDGDPSRPSGSDPAADAGVSFTRQVAPILVSRCGQCHVSDSKGGLNMATFAALMKGPPEGVVIFAGDTVGSRLIETIETGDMPRGGGKVTSEELELLKTWIKTGAKFDGPDPAAPIAAGVSPPPQTPANRPQVRRPTGNETVSFAADVAPLLVANCNGCHIDAMQTRGGLRMDTFAQMLRGGDSGAVVVPGKGETSLLVKKLRGAVGERMPTGGREALPPESIQLISTWIDEGATLDGASENQPLGVMSQLAWAAAASPAELSQRRAELAQQNLKLVVSGGNIETQQTEHFLVTGTASAGTIELVARQAETQMKLAKTVVRSESEEAYFRGRATIFVLPRRYDYSELAKMVEQRTVPSQWSSHWKFDGIDAYVAMVASEGDDEDQIADRLALPIVALAVATRGQGVPRWLAEGVGTAVASRRSATRDRDAKMRLEAELSAAFAAMDNAKKFLDGKMTAEQSDRIGAAIATTMLDRSYRRGFDALVRHLEAGAPFDQSFQQSFGIPLEAFVSNWLKFVRGG